MADDEEIRRRQLLYRGALASAAGVAGLTTLGKIFLEGGDDTTDNPGNGTPSPTEPGNGTPTSPEPESPTPPTDSEPTDNGTEEPTDDTPTNSDDPDNGGYRDPFVSSVNVGDLPQYKDINQEFDIEATVSGYDLSHIELGYVIVEDESGRGSTDYIELETDEIDEDGFTEYTIEFDDYEHSKEETVEFYAVAYSDDGDHMEDSEVVEFLDF